MDLFKDVNVKCNLYMRPCITKPVTSSMGIFVVKTHCMGQNDQFFFYAKNR